MASIYENERDNSIIIINGERMTLREYKARQKEKAKAEQPKKRKPKTQQKEINVLATEVEKMLKDITALKSFASYYDHAYRQWGTIAKDILNIRSIRVPFVSYRVQVSELNSLLGDVEKMSKRNEKDIYQFFEKIAWKLDDIKTNINLITQAVNRSGVCQQFKTHECINGKGKRLGLQTLVFKAHKAVDNLEGAIKRLNDIVKNGVDAMDYEKHLSFKQRRRVM